MDKTITLTGINWLSFRNMVCEITMGMFIQDNNTRFYFYRIPDLSAKSMVIQINSYRPYCPLSN